MAIELIDDEEQFEIEIEGCAFSYRRIPSDLRARLQRRFSKRGEIRDWQKLALATLDYGLLGWSGVKMRGENAPFTPENVAKLPDPVLAVLVESISGSVAGEVPLDPTRTLQVSSEPAMRTEVGAVLIADKNVES